MFFQRPIRLFSIVAILALLLAQFASPRAAVPVAHAAGNYALDFGSGSANVTFGAATSTLGLSTFTLETWFKRTGAGTAVNTGNGGVTAIPLITKGMHEVEGSNVDMNYFLGIDQGTGCLAADFEDMATGANHPVVGTTALANNTWYHAAVSYDGATWRLYLNGNPEATLAVNQAPRSDSIQHAGLAVAMNSTGVTEGHFQGLLDEVRIWSVVRTQAQIQGTMAMEVTGAQPGLRARWGMNEGAGTMIGSTAGTAVDGTLRNSPAWVAGAPALSEAVTVPAAPTGLTATAVAATQINLTWTDASANELDFAVERGAAAGGPFAALGTAPANTPGYHDTGLTPSTAYCYRVRARNSAGSSDPSNVQCATTPATTSNYALDFGSGSANVTFGAATSTLGLSTFTLETWFKRTGVGTTTNTGTGGVTAVPLLTKGRAQNDGSDVDMNYFLGIEDSTGLLVADMEEGATGTTPGLNHPVRGTTAVPVTDSAWHHAAVTYNGTRWQLFLDGRLETSLAVGEPVRADSSQWAGLATAMNSSGAAEGHFQGLMDEVRIWNTARTPEQILADMNREMAAAQPGLVARWGMDENGGTVIHSSAGTTIDGGIVGTGYGWAAGAPLGVPPANHAPDVPTLTAPVDGATGLSLPLTLNVRVTDPDASPLTVTFYGKCSQNQADSADFTIVLLPDTQNYTVSRPDLFTAQTLWALQHKSSANIAYVAHLGDITNDGDSAPAEWTNANNAMTLLGVPPEGIPYGLAVGNHDMTPYADPNGTTTQYNQYFGTTQFQGRPYYGGHYGTNNDSHYDLITAGGLDLIVIYIKYGLGTNSAVLSWADGLLKTHAGRYGIVVNHNIGGTGSPNNFSSEGQAIYNALKNNANFSLLLGGHSPGVGRRTDVYGGHTVYSLVQDYQGEPNGGNSWLRLLEFSPTNNLIRVKTYAPALDQYKTDANNQFTLPYTFSPDFQEIGHNTGVASGSNTTIAWPGLTPGSACQWYTTVSDGQQTTTSPIWSFSTGAAGQRTLTVNTVGSGTVVRNPDRSTYGDGESVQLTAVPATGWYFAGWSGSLTGSTNPQTIAMNGDKAVTAEFTSFPPSLPSSFWGALQMLDGQSHSGQNLQVYVPGVTDAVATAVIGSPETYAVDVPADVSGTLAKEGGVEGDVVTFKLGGRVLATAAWRGGSNVQLNLHPPEASAGGPNTGKEGDPISFAATAVDGGGDVATYAWDWNHDGLFEATGKNMQHTWSSAGVYLVSLRVTDAVGGESQADFQVNVADVPPSNVNAGGPYTAVAGEPLTLNGSATCAAVDTCAYAWDLDADGAFDDAAGLTPSIHLNTAGVYSIGLRVTDNEGTAAGATASLTVQSAVQSLALQPGWNLVSFSLLPASTETTQVLASLAGNYDLVYAWSGQTQTWRKYDAGGPPFANTLLTLDRIQGLWIHMTGAGTLVVRGNVADSTTVPLYAGWNLTGYPANVERPLPAALQAHGVGTDFGLIFAYHPADSADPWKLFDRTSDFPPDLPAMKAGWGYWVQSGGTHDWVVDYAAP